MARYKYLTRSKLDASLGAADVDLITLTTTAPVGTRAVLFTLYNAGTANAEVRKTTTPSTESADVIRPGEVVELPPIYWPLVAGNEHLYGLLGALVYIKVRAGVA